MKKLLVKILSESLWAQQDVEHILRRSKLIKSKGISKLLSAEGRYSLCYNSLEAFSTKALYEREKKPAWGKKLQNCRNTALEFVCWQVCNYSEVLAFLIF